MSPLAPDSAAKFIEAVVALLVPFTTRRPEREALLTLAFSGLDDGLLRQVDYEGSAEVFAVRLVRVLAERGIVSGEPALWILLKSVRERVGTDQQAQIDALRPLVPFYTRAIAGQVRRERVTRQIITGVAGVAVFGLLIFAVGNIVRYQIDRIIPTLTPQATPTRDTMANCEVGIGVAYFGTPSDGSVNAADARALLDRIYGRLNVELGQIAAALPYHLCWRGPDLIGTVSSEDEARTTAETYKARVILYGQFEQTPNGLMLRPRYHADPRTFAQAVEMGGNFRLGNPVPVVNLSSPTFETNQQLSARVTSIAQVFKGLTYYAAEDYTNALAAFSSAAKESWGAAGGADTLNILIGNAHLRLASVAAQKGDLSAAQSSLDQCFAAYNAAKANNANRADASYGRVNIALASASFVAWSLEQQKTRAADPNLDAPAAHLLEGRTYAAQIDQATDQSYGREVAYQGVFARMQIEYALWQHYPDQFTTPEQDELLAATRRAARRVISAYDDGDHSLGYLAAESHWYLGLLEFNTGCATALPEFEAATDSKTGASPLRQMFFWDSVAECREELKQTSDAAAAYRKALALAQQINKAGDMERYIALYRSKLEVATPNG